jgi:hypothetical protein
MNRAIAWSHLTCRGAVPLLLLFSAGLLRAADESKPDDYWTRTHVFRLIIGAKHNLHFANSFKDVQDPSKSIIILLGKDMDGSLGKVPYGLESYVGRGGAVLIASDLRVEHQALNGFYGVMIDGQKVRNKDKGVIYNDQTACPLVDGSMDPSGLFLTGPTPFSDGDERPVATNLPSYLRSAWPWPKLLEAKDLVVKATLPPKCFLDVAGKRTLSTDFSDKLPFAVGFHRGVGDHGRLLVMADHSVFINEMMQRTDTGNAAFAFRCINWLDDNGKRDQVLFVENGDVMGPVTVIDLQELPVLPPQPKPSLNTLIGIVDQMIADLENPKQGDNHFYDHLTDQHLPATWPRVLIFSLTAALLCYGLSRLWRARHRPDLSGPPLALAVVRAAPGDNPIDRRYQALIQSGNLWEPARMLTRSFFDTLLAVPAGRPGPTRLPPLHVKPRGLRGWLLGQRIRRMWRFAHQPQPQMVSFRQFRKLARRVADLKDKAAQGLFRFSPLPPPSVARKPI